MNTDEIKKIRGYLTKTEWLWESEHCPTDYDRSEELLEHRYYLKQTLDALSAAEQNRAAVRKEVLEEIIKVSCRWCGEGQRAVKNPENGIYQHPLPDGYLRGWCGAERIYPLLEVTADADQGQPEEPDSYTDRELKCTGCMGPCGRCDEADQGQAGKEG